MFRPVWFLAMFVCGAIASPTFALGAELLPLIRPTCTLADSLPGGGGSTAEPALFAETRQWSAPRLIVPATQAYALADVQSSVMPASFVSDDLSTDDTPARITFLPPPDGVRRSGDERRTTALWAETNALEWYIADQDVTPHWRHTARTAAIGMMSGLIVANMTPFNGDPSRTIDLQVHDWYQSSVRSEKSDDIARTAKLFGEGNLLFPTTIALYAATRLYRDGPIFEPVGIYSDRLFRSFACGAPLLIAGQFITGASRPYEPGGDQSHWHFLADNNGVSGHAFVGAMPFLVAAHMSENWFWKSTFYAASGMTAWSRVNDGAHFSSQIFLGWSLACAVSLTVAEQPIYNDHVAVMPVVSPDMTGIAIMISR